MKSYDEMILKLVSKGKISFFPTKGRIVKAVEAWVASLSEKEKDKEIVRIDKPPVKVKDVPKALAEDKDFRKFWVRKSRAYYNEFLRGKA